MFLNESKILSVLGSESNISYIIALDEVGRGAGAGPVVVCTSVWKRTTKQNWCKPKWLSLVADSKLLTREKREECFGLIGKDFLLSEDHLSNSFIENNIRLYAIHEKTYKPNKVFSLSEKELKSIKSVPKEMFNFLFCSMGVAINEEIDETNIWFATQIAANRGILNLLTSFATPQNIDFTHQTVILMDGKLPVKVSEDFIDFPQVTITNGDALFKTIGCSSILAKVCRDKYMTNLHAEFPDMGFAQHKGYLTAQHRTNLKIFGQTRFHRQSFLTKTL